MLRNLFGGDTSASKPVSTRSTPTGPRIPRYSSGWGNMLRYFKEQPHLRILDIGPTSPNNINYLTNLGHSIYMADLVEEAAQPKWQVPQAEGEPDAFDVEGFIAENMDFAGRSFDAVLLWDALDYLPESLVAPLIARLQEVTHPGALLLGFFHARAEGPECNYYRYHLTDESTVQMQQSGDYKVLRIYNNRSIERLFADFSSYKFFLAKDNVREVIVTR
ncbi:MAG: methyltransferase domain-containing protein [Acidobacteriaceae bacterium]